MTTGSDIHDRVIQAMGRDKDLLDQLVSLGEQVLTAKATERAVIESSTLEADKQRAAEQQAEALVKVKEVHDALVSVAEAPFACAQAKFDEATTIARGELTAAESKIQEIYESAVAETTEQHLLAENEARAMVHRLGQEQRAIRNTVAQHRNQILGALGIKLDEPD